MLRYPLTVIRTAWIAIVLWLEIGIFLAASLRCRWPRPGGVLVRFIGARRGLVSCLTADLGQGNNEKAATHILLVADPQILDDRSYPERSSLLRTVSRIFVDMNLRKAWRVAKSKRPHAVIFLGDMMDNGFADMHITECVYRTLLAVLIPPPSSSSFPSLNSFPPLSPPL